MLSTTANPTGLRITYLLSGKKVEVNTISDSMPPSSSSNLAALETTTTDSQPPSPPTKKTRSKSAGGKAVEGNGEKGKPRADKGKQKAVEDDVLEISSDEPAPKIKKTSSLSSAKPAYVSSGSDHDDDDSEYEVPSTAVDLKRKARASPQPDITHSRSVRSRGSPSPSHEHDVPLVVGRSRRSKPPAVNLAWPNAKANPQQASTSLDAGEFSPSQEHRLLPITTRPVRPRPTAEKLVQPKAMTAPGGKFSSSGTPRLLARDQSVEERARVTRELNMYARPNVGRGSAAPSSSLDNMPRMLTPTPDDATPPVREAHTPTPMCSRAAEASAEVVSAAAPINAPTAALAQRPADASVAAPAPPPHVARPPMMQAQSLPSTAPQQGEAAPPMTHAQSSQGRPAAPQHEYPEMHQGPPGQGFWGQPTYYHPSHGYPQVMPNYGHGYNPGAFAGQQIYHPQLPQQGPSNAPYNMPMSFAGQMYPPGALLNQPQHQQPGSSLRGASPPASPFIARDGNYQVGRHETDGPV